MDKETIVGVIADTHGLLRPEAVAALASSDLILHAGDVGAEEILEALRRIAPLFAIRGNIDTQPWARELPETESIEVAGVTLFMLHNLDDLDLNPASAGFAAVIYGHSHQPESETRKGVLYFNPGSAGPRRFKLPVSLGRLRIKDGNITPQLVPLAV